MFTLLAIENNQISRKIGALTCFQLQRSGVDFLIIIRPAFALSHKMLKIPKCPILYESIELSTEHTQ